MFMTKKRKMYAAYELITDYIRSDFETLQNLIFDPADDDGALCSLAATVLYLGILFGGSSAHYDLYRMNFQDQPDLQSQIDQAVNEMIDYTETKAAQTYYQALSRPNQVRRLAADPYNEILDRQYGKLIYAIQRFADEHYIYYRHDIDESDLCNTLYDYFVRHEPTAKPFVDKVRSLFS